MLEKLKATKLSEWAGVSSPPRPELGWLGRGCYVAGGDYGC